MQITVYENGKIAVEKSAYPVLKSGEARIKIKACGICGSDVPRVFAGKSYYYPIVLGHEFSGVVEASENKSLVGKRVCVFPVLPCKECEFCKQEAWANCKNYDYYGSRRNGGMQEYLAVREENLVVLPDNVSFEAGAMLEPTAVTLHAMKKAHLRGGERVLIYGAGTIGLLCGMWARCMGAERVDFIDIDAKKIEFARGLGFTAYENGEADVVVEASGAQACVNGAIEKARAFGRIVIVGNPHSDMCIRKENYAQILRKQLILCGCWNSDFSTRCNEWAESVNAISAGKIQPEKLITHTFPMAEGDKAFAVLANGEFYNKIMVVEE